MAEQYVALLRGINVGRAKRVAMADLREALSSLGNGDVKTLLNSGNVVFSAEKAPAANELQKAVADRTGVRSDIVLMTGQQLVQAVDENPLADVATDPSRLLVMFFAADGDRQRLRTLLDEEWDSEQLAVGRRVAYLWCPAGFVASPLREAAEGLEYRDTVTTRNWRTVTRLRALLD